MAKLLLFVENADGLLHIEVVVLGRHPEGVEDVVLEVVVDWGYFDLVLHIDSLDLRSFLIGEIP